MDFVAPVEAVTSRAESRPGSPNCFWIPVRVVIITALVTLMSFAVVLLLALVGLIVRAQAHGLSPNLTVAYHRIALPTAIVIGGATLVSCSVLEMRRYREAKALARIERIS
jgi:ABC-type enterochelin transport system permease subunit